MQRLRLFLPLVVLGLCACTTLPKQTKAVLSTANDLDRSHQIQNVKFIEQAADQCGPATLAMALDYVEMPVTVQTLEQTVFTDTKKGSLQTSLIGGARRQGLMAVQIQGLENLLREVGAGHPVIVFQNLALSWWPKWHYALVTGYDLDQRTITLHSGPDKNKTQSLGDFEIDWEGGNYWGLVVLKPDALSMTATEMEHINSAAILENLKHTKQAEAAYTAILTRWPTSLGALIGLGNIYYASGRSPKAVDVLQKALRYHPGSKTARHNLDVALKAAKLN